LLAPVDVEFRQDISLLRFRRLTFLFRDFTRQLEGVGRVVFWDAII